MSGLEEILNGDLPKCEIVESVENATRRVDLIKWAADGLFSVADLRKDAGKLEISEVPCTEELEAYKYYYKTYWSFVVSAQKSPR